MTYKTVMVGLGLGQPNDSRLETAAQLAERFSARVIGVAAAEFSPPLYFTDGDAAQRLIDQGLAAIKNRLAELEGEFRAAMQNRALENGAAPRTFRRGTSSGRPTPAISSWSARPPAARWPIHSCKSIRAIS